MNLGRLVKRLMFGLVILAVMLVVFTGSNIFNLQNGQSRGTYYNMTSIYRVSNTVSQEVTTRIDSAAEGNSYADIFNSANMNGVTHPLTAQEIVDSISKKLGNSEKTAGDIFAAVNHWNIVSINRSEVDNIKIILGYQGFGQFFQGWLNFTHCAYTNCVAVNPHQDRKPRVPVFAPEIVTKAADIILFNAVKMSGGRTLSKIPRSIGQYLGISSIESTGFEKNFISSRLDKHGFNFTITYSRDSTIPAWHMYKGCREKREIRLSSLNYKLGKTKGALAYVSHCDSAQYNRLNMLESLSRYINVDIFGKCGQPDPCRNTTNTKECIDNRHRQYHFYLSFENSLCQDYITEKFWDNLADPTHMVPVAMGGLTVQEYTDLAPENSFIHVRNFTSIEKLGNYLKYLTENPESYNAYHKWREIWNLHKLKFSQRLPACELCRIANEKPYMPPLYGLSKIYNDPRLCSNYPAFPSNST